MANPIFNFFEVNRISNNGVIGNEELKKAIIEAFESKNKKFRLNLTEEFDKQQLCKFQSFGQVASVEIFAIYFNGNIKLSAKAECEGDLVVTNFTTTLTKDEIERFQL